MILGCRRRGRPRDGPMSHKNGKGWVKAHEGAYHDAQYKKRSTVVPFIVETTGGIVPHARVQVGRLARRAEGKGKRDSTKYGSSRTSARTFFHHHVQQLSKAAVVGDAQAMRRDESAPASIALDQTPAARPSERERGGCS